MGGRNIVRCIIPEGKASSYLQSCHLGETPRLGNQRIFLLSQFVSFLGMSPKKSKFKHLEDLSALLNCLVSWDFYPNRAKFSSQKISLLFWIISLLEFLPEKNKLQQRSAVRLYWLEQIRMEGAYARFREIHSSNCKSSGRRPLHLIWNLVFGTPTLTPGLLQYWSGHLSGSIIEAYAVFLKPLTDSAHSLFTALGCILVCTTVIIGFLIVYISAKVFIILTSLKCMTLRQQADLESLHAAVEVQNSTHDESYCRYCE